MLGAFADTDRFNPKQGLVRFFGHNVDEYLGNEVLVFFKY